MQASLKAGKKSVKPQLLLAEICDCAQGRMAPISRAWRRKSSRNRAKNKMPIQGLTRS
jgi:hypothetical protein